MVRSRKKQCSVSIFCSTLQCNRGTEICPICMAGQQEELCFSLVLHSTSQWIRAEAILNVELCYSQDITSHHFVIFKAPPTLIAHSTRLNSLQISVRFSLDQSNLHGKEQKEAVSCATFWQHFAMHARNGEK